MVFNKESIFQEGKTYMKTTKPHFQSRLLALFNQINDKYFPTTHFKK